MSIDMNLFYKFIKDKNSIFKLPENSRFEIRGTKANDSVFSEVYNHYNSLIKRESGLFYIKNNEKDENYGFINDLNTTDFHLNGDIKFSQINLKELKKSTSNNLTTTCKIENLGVRTSLIKYNENENKYYIPGFYKDNLTVSTYILNGEPILINSNNIDFINSFSNDSNEDETGTNANGLYTELLNMNNGLKVGNIDIDLGMNCSDTELEVKPGTSKFVSNNKKIEFHIKGSAKVEDPKYLDETKSEGSIAFFDVDGYYPIFCESDEKVGFEIENNSSLYDGKDIVRIYSNKLVEDENYTEVSTL